MSARVKSARGGCRVPLSRCKVVILRAIAFGDTEYFSEDGEVDEQFEKQYAARLLQERGL